MWACESKVTGDVFLFALRQGMGREAVHTRVYCVLHFKVYFLIHTFWGTEWKGYVLKYLFL